MINKQILLGKLEDNKIEGVFNKTLDFDLEYNGYSVRNNSDLRSIELFDQSGKLLMNDLANYITEFTPELLDIEFSSILVAGLGLGLIHYVVQDFCDTIDVVEINTDIIDLNKSLNILDSKVRIVNDDCFTFIPEKKYNVILLDIWYTPISDEVVRELTERYAPFLSEGGFLYFPIIDVYKGDRASKIYNL